MTYTKKSELLATQPNTATGAAGNMLSVPGWIDVAGGTWRINTASVICDTGDDTHRLTHQYLNTYSTNAGEGNQRVIFEIPAGTTAIRRNVWLRSQFGTGKYIRMYFALVDLLVIYWNNGTIEDAVVASALNLNNTKRYRVTFQAAGTIAGGGITVTVTVYNVTDSTPHLWNAGSATYTTLITLGGAPEYGTIELLDDASSTFGLPLEVWTEGIAALTAPTIVKTATGATTQIVFTPAGGVLPMTVTMQRGATHLTGSPATFIGTALTFSEPSLTPLTHYRYAWAITDSLAQSQSAQFDLATRQPIWPSQIMLLGVGDSSTVGGTPRPSQTARDYIANYLGITDPALSDETTVAQVGYTSAQMAAIAAEIVQVANGAYTGPNTVGGTLANYANLVVIRLGKYDSASTPAQTKASVQTIINAIRAGCPNDPVILVLPITGYQGTGADNTSLELDRQYRTNLAFRELDAPADLVYACGMHDWYFLAATPAYVDDDGQPLQAQMPILALNMAACYFQRHILGGAAEWAASSGGGTSVFGY